MTETQSPDPAKLQLSERMKTWKFWKPVAFAFGGGLAGFLYYYFVGCSSGSCPITSNPFISIIFGSVMGFLLYKQ